MSRPVVRIIMPAYNAERFIERAVESILAQSFSEWELVIVDDGSSDRTAEVISQLCDERISLIRQNNAGPEAARQRGFAGCQAEFVARMDADDVMDGGRLRLQVEFLRSRPEVGAVGGQIRFLSEDGRRSGFPSNYPLEHEEIRRRMYGMACSFCNATIVCRRALLARVQDIPMGGPGADVHYVLRLAAITRLANVPQVVHYVRIHEKSIQSSFDPMKRLQRARFGLACVRAEAAGQPEPSWEQFARSWSRRPIWQRLRDRRLAALGRIAGRARWHALNGAMFPQGSFYMTLAAVLAPGRALRRIADRYVGVPADG